MSFFLKKTAKKKGTYIQIYESQYSKDRGHAVQACYKSIGYLEDLIAQGGEDPISRYQREVDELNAAARSEKMKKKEGTLLIGKESPLKYVGYFPIKKILDQLGVAAVMDALQETRDFEFRTYDVLSALVFSRLIDPRSKRSTVNCIVPNLFTRYDFSYAQTLACIEFLGNNYEKYVELFTKKVQYRYGHNTANAYFDCTNFYFEIDKEDEFRKKGPSKENRHDPLVGMGLLLDADLIPIGMTLYPGNQNEQKHLRETIEGMKKKGHITGKTVQIADKGLNCAQNINEAISGGAGYIFTKSIKGLPEKEQLWVFNNDGWIKVIGKNNKTLYLYKECTDKFTYSFTDKEGKPKSFTVKEKRVVTYNPTLARKQKAEIKKLADKANNLCYTQAKKSEFGDAGKYLDFRSIKDEKDKVIAVFNQEKYENDLKYAGYNLIVTSEIDMEARMIYKKYHELWRIEESFRIMKTYLDARPVFLQKQETIQGHFLICYVAVLLLRLFQIKELEDKFTTDEIIRFIRDFRLIKRSGAEYLNLSQISPFIEAYAQKIGIPLKQLYLSKQSIQKMNLKK